MKKTIFFSLFTMQNSIIKNHISRSFIVLLMVILWGGYLSAKTIYVDVNAASATKNGTKLFPYNKIQTGIDSSKSKDTIYVGVRYLLGNMAPTWILNGIKNVM